MRGSCYTLYVENGGKPQQEAIWLLFYNWACISDMAECSP